MQEKIFPNLHIIGRTEKKKKNQTIMRQEFKQTNQIIKVKLSIKILSIIF